MKHSNKKAVHLLVDPSVHHHCTQNVRRIPSGASHKRVIEGEIIGFSPSTRTQLADHRGSKLSVEISRTSSPPPTDDDNETKVTMVSFFPKIYQILAVLLSALAMDSSKAFCRRRNSDDPQAAAAAVYREQADRYNYKSKLTIFLL